MKVLNKKSKAGTLNAPEAQSKPKYKKVQPPPAASAAANTGLTS